MLVITAVMSDSLFLGCLSAIISISKSFMYKIPRLRKYEFNELRYKSHMNQQNKINEGMQKATVLLIRNHSVLLILTKWLYVNKKLTQVELQLILKVIINRIEL